MMKMKRIISFCTAIALSQTMLAQPGDEDARMYNVGKERDSIEVSRAVKGWWKAAEKTKDQRLKWWRDARFGMFIHWGVYSLPGGEWKGKKVSGYAEHLMRKEKISRVDYLQLAAQFNPLAFHADEWIGHAKRAGMKYFIITAKHHDGFALYESKVSSFDITDATPFKRDPMAELASAAKKAGMRFGFYYSHAFDWEHPQAPGNDWEYKNPGGDLKLHGDRDWYDLHPELLVKARKYVDEKAIPQILELITRYHPDILWFDTPQKLPLSENVRILEAIRKADPGIVVNGRLVRSASANLGDYKNTADRPAEFFPVTGDWEAIPTTNESYGYHKFDSSHKPVSHFIQLLANAASRGGNLLMNIGPMGNGAFDAKDLQVLKGIGKWMDTYGESIYGTTASVLPLQNWGVSTTKGNKIYLHIFNYPMNGYMRVAGLRTPVTKAYLLNDPKRPLRFTKSSGNYNIEIPLTAPDKVNTVLVLETGGKPKADPVPFLSDWVHSARLLAFDAKQHGKGLTYGDGKTDRYYVENWKSKEQSLEWTFRNDIVRAYSVTLHYIPGNGAGSRYALVVDGKRTEHVVSSGGNKVLREKLRDRLYLPAGYHRIQLLPIEIKGSELFKPLEITLEAIPFKN